MEDKMEEKAINQFFINQFKKDKIKKEIQSRLKANSLYTVFRITQDGVIPGSIIHCTAKKLLNIYDTAVKNKDMAFSFREECNISNIEIQDVIKYKEFGERFEQLVKDYYKAKLSNPNEYYVGWDWSDDSDQEIRIKYSILNYMDEWDYDDYHVLILDLIEFSKQ